MTKENQETGTEQRFGNIKPREVYIKPGDSIDRIKFREEILRYARDRQISVSTALKEFFTTSTFTKREMGRFALSATRDESLVDGTVILIHALGVSEEEAPSLNILQEYIGASKTDPQVWGASWIIDSMLNWKQGTILPESREQLQRL